MSTGSTQKIRRVGHYDRLNCTGLRDSDSRLLNAIVSCSKRKPLALAHRAEQVKRQGFLCLQLYQVLLNLSRNRYLLTTPFVCQAPVALMIAALIWSAASCISSLS